MKEKAGEENKLKEEEEKQNGEEDKVKQGE